MEFAMSQQMRAIIDGLGGFADLGTSEELWEALRRPEACDFMFGNPHDMPLPGYVEALRRGLEPTGKDHYAYTMDLPAATAAIGAGLRERFGLAFRDEDVHMTNGNFAGLAILLRLLGGPRRRGDLRLAAVVLLRGADRRVRRHARPCLRGPNHVRPGSRGDRRRPSRREPAPSS